MSFSCSLPGKEVSSWNWILLLRCYRLQAWQNSFVWITGLLNPNLLCHALPLATVKFLTNDTFLLVVQPGILCTFSLIQVLTTERKWKKPC
jgi:hypothetical protein